MAAVNCVKLYVSIWKVLRPHVIVDFNTRAKRGTLPHECQGTGPSMRSYGTIALLLVC